MIEYKEFGLEEFERVKEIYRGEGWAAYLHDDEALKRAFKNSIYCLGAYDGNQLIGFVRCVGDGEHIVLVQDLIVVADYQRKKIGTSLFKKAWDKYIHVRMFQVNTDIEDERDNLFYKASGMKPISEGNMISYYR
ncbi:Acetyltransferase (GNAT) domain-containing protein [Butyrivibrio sp. ob235]|uniref:GNAT family N-acetyltransferase n=1 Tax=Butyrivibrio sp. ob235 TaxID=1761780 RepID=UPI0008CE473D|nr:GNAT family N-acetyltransferase [Butyrivibrio sp. ob235]SEL12836.1 Acetyltransferase (GNAT) domain-containing protein [Butyrivibrio sp. ob235]